MDAPVDEIAALKSEVAELKQRFDELMQFLVIDRDSPDQQTRLRIRCHGFQFESTTQPGVVGIEMDYVEDCPRLTLTCPHECGSLELSTDDQSQPRVTLWGTDNKPRVQLSVDEDDRGIITAHQPGGAATAVMRAAEKGGAMVILNRDRKTRAGMICKEDEHGGHGEVSILSDANHLAAKMTAAEHGGALVALSRGNSGVCAVMSAEKDGGTVMVTGDETDGFCVMRSSKDLETIGAYSDSKGGPSVGLFAGESAASVTIRDPSDTEVASLTGTGAGADLELRRPGGESVARLSGLTTGGMLTIKGEGGKTTSRFLCAAEMAMLHVGAPDGGTADGIFLSTQKGKQTIHINDAGELRTFLGHDGEAGRLMIRAAGDSDANVQINASGEVANVIIQGPGEILQAALGTTENGGRLSLNNELGISRADLAVLGDGGSLRLNWGGTTAVIAAATDHGGVVIVNDPAGETVETLPREMEPDED